MLKLWRKRRSTRAQTQLGQVSADLLVQVVPREEAGLQSEGLHHMAYRRLADQDSTCEVADLQVVDEAGLFAGGAAVVVEDRQLHLVEP